MKNKYFEMAQMFKALCDENRIRIIEMLQSGEMCAANILEELDVTQPTLSHHMKTLCESGIVKFRKSGKWTYYSISEKGFRIIRSWLEKVVSDTESEAEAETPQISLEMVAAQRTKDLLAPRSAKKTAASKKKKAAAKNVKDTAENTLPQEEKFETPKRRDVDIVIL